MTVTADIQTTRIATAVKTLAANQGKRISEIPPSVGMTRSKFYRRMTDESWTALEVARLAAFFSVPVGLLYRDPADMIDTTSRFFRLTQPSAAA